MTRYQKELMVGYVAWFILVGLSAFFDCWTIFIVGIAVMGGYGMCQAVYKPETPVAYLWDFFSWVLLAAIFPLAVMVNCFRR